MTRTRFGRQTKLEAEGLEALSEDEDGEDEERHPDDQAEFDAKQKAAREAHATAAEAAAADAEGRTPGVDEGGEAGDEGKENKRGGGAVPLGGGAETVDSLLGKLKDLHAEMRARHGVNLKKANGEVLALQRRAEKVPSGEDQAMGNTQAKGSERGRENASKQGTRALRAPERWRLACSASPRSRATNLHALSLAPSAFRRFWSCSRRAPRARAERLGRPSGGTCFARWQTS
jgi:hypothetical protein